MSLTRRAVLTLQCGSRHTGYVSDAWKHQYPCVIFRLFLPRDKDAEELIHREPALLFISLDTVVRDIRRLMPTADPRTVGFATSAWCCERMW